MTQKTVLLKKITVWLLVATILMPTIPALLLPTGAASIVLGDKTADISTMDSWKQLFPADNTSQAGRIWTDKSVFTNADAFQNLKDVNGQNISIAMKDEDNNFLVALSALASNKSIVGYSYTPTDTMLVLDASGSMGDSGYVDDLVMAANSAIKELLTLNKHNRIGVVLYSGHPYQNNASSGSTATVLLPLDRYSHAQNQFLVNSRQDSISVNSNVKNKNGQSVSRKSKEVSGATYIQNGLYMAMNEFLDVEDTVIPDGETQAGTARTPIFVLMSDGLPTAATTNFAGQNNTAQTVGLGNSNLGFGGTITDNVLATAVDFVNQLTAAYATAKVDAHYAKTAPLFYTLGLGKNNANLDSAVLDPSGHTNTDELWQEYVATANRSSLIIDIESRRYNPDQASIYKIPEITQVSQKQYVTGHYAASNANGLIEAFQTIVNQIIIQSLYYPTLVENGDFDHDGFVEFIDDIGHYMDVKDIKGILIGNTVFTGERLARNFVPTGGALINADGTYTELGNNMVRSVQRRIGIADIQDARDLINSAYEAGQLRYYPETGEWSNYIGWYADDAGNFMGHWHEGHTENDIPTINGVKATYINKSYGMLGEITGEHTATDLMYISTQIHTRISDGNVSFVWRIPASLVPVVSYNITLNGENLADSTGASIAYKPADPISILFEVGLSDEINPVNVSDIITDHADHILDAATDGDTVSDDGKYYFYTNWWNDENLSHENPSKVQDTIVFFEPSLQNERYYYAEETAVYINTGTEQAPAYARYKGNKPTVDDGRTYFRQYAVFVGTGAATEKGIPATIEYQYEVMSDDTIGVLQDEHRNADGSWDVPMGTIYRVLEPYNVEKTDKTLTATLDYVRYPVIEEIPQKDAFHVGAILGNNGRLAVEIPQGIKISKIVDDTLYGTDNTYTFRVEAGGLSGTFKAYTEAADGTLTLTSVTFTNGETEVSLKANEAVYILGVDEDTAFTVTEIIKGKYAVKSIAVNGIAQTGTAVAAASVEKYAFTDVVFENTLVVNTGTMVVSKEIVHNESITYNANQGYTFEWYNQATPNDKHTFSMKANETKVISDLTPGTYVVSEINIPDGYTPRNNNIVVVIPDSAGAVVPVHFINDYTPAAVKLGNITVSGTKHLVGREWKAGDTFTFKLQALQGATWVDIAERTISYNAAGDDDYLFDFSNDDTLKDLAIEIAGTHRFRIMEVIPDTKIGGITYDTTYRYFSITVTDETMDGKLEINEVTAAAPVTVTTSNTGNTTFWNVEADFTNTYAAGGADELIVTIDKTVTDRVGAGAGKDGFTFGLYAEGGTTPILVTDPTNEQGKTSFDLTFPAAVAGREYHFEIRELIPENKVEGMTYVTTPYPITIKIVDNLDGTITAVVVTPDEEVEGIAVAFENIYDPADAEVTLSGTKVMEGRDFAANEFTFELYKEGETVPKVAVNDSKANGGTFIFDKLTFDTIGTYKYTIKEKSGTLGGVAYSGKVYNIEIVVSDDTDNDGRLNALVKVDGTAVADSAITNAIRFVNVYTAKPVDVKLEGTKTLTGRDLKDGEFKFDLYNADASFNKGSVKQDDVKLVLQASGTGKIAFEPLTFTAVGDYYYVVIEDETDGKGIIVDKTAHTVHVAVSDKGVGQLEAVVEVDGVVIIGSTATAITFANTYVAEDAKVTLEATKTLLGRDLKDGEFKFDLYNADAAFNKGTVVQNDVALVLQPDGTGKVTFGELTFSKAQDRYYLIVEDEIDENGVTVDKTAYKIHIAVTDKGEGKLEATTYVDDTVITGSTASTITFTNTYKADSVKVGLTGTKTLTGRDLKDGEFKFDLYNADANFNKGAVKEDDVKLTLQPDGTGKITFADLTFDTVGTYRYIIMEDELDEKGITTDKTVYNVTITVSDVGLGQLSAAVKVNNVEVTDSTADVVKFANSYKANSVKVGLTGTKTLTGRELKDGEFKFDLYNADASFNKGAVKEDDVKLALQPDGTGKITFADLIFDTVGTYRYMVIEDEVDGNGVTVDKTSYRITVTVTDEGVGQLKAVVKVNDVEITGSTATAITFANSYKADAVNVGLTGTKTLTGRDLEDGEFKFDLYNADVNFGKGTVEQDNVKLVLQADGTGKITFADLTFDTVGIYRYLIVEDELDEKGITTDKTVYKVTITVTDAGVGRLAASVKINDVTVTGSTAQAVTFANSYKVAVNTIKLQGFKTLKDKDLVGDDFSFELYDADGVRLETVKNRADGTITFTEIDVDKAGVYTYTVKEVLGDVEGITYDTTVYTVTVTVTDNGDGTLSLVYTYEKQDQTKAEAIVFANTYTAPVDDNPQTGTISSSLMWIALLFVSGGLFTTVLRCKKQKSKENA